MKIQIVAPVHNESSGLEVFCSELEKVLISSSLDYQIFLVDDGSTDDSWQQIDCLAQSNPRLTGVKLAKNFGKDGAIFAGLSEADSSYVASIVLDSDLQHPPSEIPRMLAEFRSGAELVVMRKTSRPDQNRIVRLGGQAWGKIISSLTGVNVLNTTDYRLISARLRTEVLARAHAQSFFRFDSSQFGFDQRFLDFTPLPRRVGTSSFSLPRLFNFAMRTITSASTKPLQLVTVAALIMILLGVVLGIQTLFNWILGTPASGFTTVILLILVLGGLQLLGLGVFGLYIGSIVDAIRNKPVFTVESVTKL